MIKLAGIAREERRPGVPKSKSGLLLDDLLCNHRPLQLPLRHQPDRNFIILQEKKRNADVFCLIKQTPVLNRELSLVLVPSLAW
jgi:hypothetical protein